MRRLAAVFSLVLVMSGTAGAHGAYTSSSPAKGDLVKKVPREVTVTLSEAPAQGSTIRVTDGCGREVAEAVQLDGSDLIGVVGGAIAPEPGNWKVAFRSISSADGHTARDSFSFKVRGQRDCARQEGPTDEKTESPEISSKPPIANDESSSFPWIPFGLGTLVLIVVALVARRASS